MSTDRVFREEDAIWWDAHVKSPRRYTLDEMDSEYEGLSGISNGQASGNPQQTKHVVVIDPNASLRVDVNWVHVAALVVIMLGVVAVVAIFAAAAVVAVVFIGVVLGTLALAFARTKP